MATRTETNRPATAGELGRMSEAHRAAYEAGTPFSYAECGPRVYRLRPIQGVPGAGAYVVQRPGAALRRVLTAMREGGGGLTTRQMIGVGALALVAARIGLSFLRPAKVIYGCEGRGDGEDPYLTRRTLLDLGPLGRLHLHTFHRSDADVYHDHPWPFVTLVLSGGYYDVTPDGGEWMLPGALRYRPADHAHRVSLIKRFSYAGDGGWVEQPATTLVWAGRVRRRWGFHLPDGWTHWRDYFERMGCRP